MSEKTTIYFVNRYGVRTSVTTKRPNRWITHIEKHGGSIISKKAISPKIRKLDCSLLGEIF